MKPVRATLSLAALEERSLMTVNPFGAAAGYNAFILGDMQSTYAETQGRLAVGGNASLTGYSVGALTAAETELLVGGDLEFNAGQVDGGGASYGGALTAKWLTTKGGSITQGPVGIDFTAAAAELAASSATLAATPATGTAEALNGGMFLTGTSGVNYFNIAAADLETAWGVVIDAPADATVVINVSGIEARLEYMGFSLTGGVTSNHVLFNFNEAHSIVMDGVSLPGGLLAPHAMLSFDNGQIIGNAAAWSMTGNGHFNGVSSDIVLPDPTYTISGNIYEDVNANGFLDAGETAPAHPVHLQLTDANGAVVAETTLDAGGAYSFPGLLAGSYKLTASSPDDAGILPGPIDLTVVADTTNVDIGYQVKPVVADTFTLSGTVFEDANANGQRDPGEDTATHPVLLQLIGPDGAVAGETTLEKGGAYSFTGLKPGLYEMAGAVTDDAGALFGPADINLTADATGFDFGYVVDKPTPPPVQTGVIRGNVFLDANRSGAYDPGETGIALQVTLTGTDAAGQAVNGSTTAGADGAFRFDGLAAGTYNVTVDLAGRGGKVLGSVGGAGGLYDATLQGIGGITLAEGQDAGGYGFGLQPLRNRYIV